MPPADSSSLQLPPRPQPTPIAEEEEAAPREAEEGAAQASVTPKEEEEVRSLTPFYLIAFAVPVNMFPV